MKWILATERLPENEGNYFVKLKGIESDNNNAEYTCGAYYHFLNTFEGKYFPLLPKHEKVIEWLDESPTALPITSDVKRNYSKDENGNTKINRPRTPNELNLSSAGEGKKREEQAEWEFLTIIQSNYGICKRGDGSEWKGYSAKAAALETYEDMIELISKLPLKGPRFSSTDLPITPSPVQEGEGKDLSRLDVSANFSYWHNLECRVKETGEKVWLCQVDGGNYHAKDKEGNIKLYRAGYDGRYDLTTTQEAISKITGTSQVVGGNWKETVQNLIDNSFWQFKAKNGKVMSVESGDGEKCMIVRSEDIDKLKDILAAAPSPVPQSDAANQEEMWDEVRGIIKDAIGLDPYRCEKIVDYLSDKFLIVKNI